MGKEAIIYFGEDFSVASSAIDLLDKHGIKIDGPVAQYGFIQHTGNFFDTELEVETVNYIRNHECEFYHAEELSAEIISCFVGAKQLPPKGPFKYEGRQYVVDGTEKRYPCHIKHEVYIGVSGEIKSSYWFADPKEFKRWVLKPLIPDEKQTLLDRAEAMQTELNNLRETIDGME